MQVVRGDKLKMDYRLSFRKYIRYNLVTNCDAMIITHRYRIIDMFSRLQRSCSVVFDRYSHGTITVEPHEGMVIFVDENGTRWALTPDEF